MPSKKYGEIIPIKERKELLFELVNIIQYNDHGRAASRSLLSLIEAIGQGDYFTESNKTDFAKRLASNEPELYLKLGPFFHQNQP